VTKSQANKQCTKMEIDKKYTKVCPSDTV